jgi:hypothetical protein
MNIQNIFDCFAFLHEAASKFIETFVLEICPDDIQNDAFDNSLYNRDNYCEEDRRGTYMHYYDHLD